MSNLNTFRNSLGLKRSGSFDSESDPVKSDVGRDGKEAAAGVQQEASAKLLPSNVASYRNFKTACLFYSSLTMGLCTPVLGSTLVHMELFFSVSTAIISLALTVRAIGGVFGALICGLVFDHVNPELAFAVASLFQGMSYVVAPFMGGVVPFMVAMGIQATATGFIGASSQSYCVGLWTGHSYRDPILHTWYAMWSLGGIVSPFIIELFLVDLPLQQLSASVTRDWSTLPFISDNIQDTASHRKSYASTYKPTSSSSWNFTSVSTSAYPLLISPSDVAGVRYAYVTIGSVTLISFVLFAISHLLNRFNSGGSFSPTSLSSHSSKQSTSSRSKESNVDDKASKDLPGCPENPPSDIPIDGDYVRLDRYLFVIFVVLVFLFYHIQRYGVTIPPTFMTEFVIKYLHFSVSSASLLMSLFFGFQFISRVLGIPLAAYVRPQTMLLFNVSFTAFFFVLLLALVDVWPIIVWITIPFGSLTMGTTFAAGILWISDRVKLTGRLSGITLIGHSSGAVVSSLVVGQLFERSTPMWFAYCLAASSVIMLLWFLLLIGYYGRYGDRVTRYSNAVLRENNDEKDTSSSRKDTSYKSIVERDDNLVLTANIETNELEKSHLKKVKR